MKTTIDISDPLLDQAREVAARDGETLRSLVEQGLRKVLAERSSKAKPFKLRHVTAGVPGARAPYFDMTWEEKRALIYGDRGG